VIDAAMVLARLACVSAKLHVYDGRISGMLHVQHPSWTHVQFRAAKGESVAETLWRALLELERRQLQGMPRTTRRAPCSACGRTDDLRYLQGAKQWLCAECRRGLRGMADERRRAKRRALHPPGRGLSL